MYLYVSIYLSIYRVNPRAQPQADSRCVAATTHHVSNATPPALGLARLSLTQTRPSLGLIRVQARVDPAPVSNATWLTLTL